MGGWVGGVDVGVVDRGDLGAVLSDNGTQTARPFEDSRVSQRIVLRLFDEMKCKT